MSKNFAEEYKALANEELPDLWDRIEAGLTPKTMPSAEKIEDVKEAEEPQDTARPPKGKVIAFFRRYRTVVAAAVCVAVILPAMMVIGRNGQKSDSAGGATATEEAADMAVPEEGVATTELWEEAPADEPESAEFEMMSEGERAAESVGMAAGAESAEIAEDMEEEVKTPQEAADDGAVSAAEKEELKDSEQKKADLQKNLNSSEFMTDGFAKTYEKITVEPVEQAEEMIEADGGLYAGVKMKVIHDPSGELSEDTLITVWVALHSSVAYLQGEEYEIDLSYDPDRECPYQIEKNYFS